MKKSLCLHALFLVMVMSLSSFLYGCSQREPSLPIESTENNTTLQFPTDHSSGGKVGLEISITPTALTPTQMEIGLPTPPKLITEIHLPDIAINFIVDNQVYGLHDCFRRDIKYQIWRTNNLFNEMTPLVDDQTTDYLFPVSSPDGERIAYIQSIPTETGEAADPERVEGGDYLWLIGSNGSEATQIMGPFPHEIFRWVNGCITKSMVFSAPSWSPDGKHIILRHQTLTGVQYETAYYWIDIDSRQSNLLSKQYKNSNPVWVGNQNKAAIIGDDGNIRILSFAENQPKVGILTIPTEAPMDRQIAIFTNPNSSQGQSSVLVAFFQKGENSDIYESLWEVDLSNKVWRKLLDLKVDLYNKPILGDRVGIACTSDHLGVIFDRTNWANIMPIEFSGEIDCSSFALVPGDSMLDVFSFVAKTTPMDDPENIDREGLWIVSAHEQRSEFKNIFMFTTIPKEQRKNIIFTNWIP